MYEGPNSLDDSVTCGCGGFSRSPGRHRRNNQSQPVSRLYFDYIRVPDHTRQETTLVHPVTQKSAVQAEAIHSPPPAATAYPSRFDATTSSSCPTPPGPINNTNTLNNHEARKTNQGSRRRSGGGSWVKTPGLKRPDVSPVTLQGWLSKQGGDGLQLWRKRWFVLSDYCLYYYKSPHEDKVLGSLPLPSFKISPAQSEDLIFRKHVFKAEHQNMRTYYFAAETKEQMTQWMNALSLASILQKDTSLEEKLGSGNSAAHRSERPSVSSLASTASPSADESDSGFHGYRSRRCYRSPDGRSLDEASESSRLQGDRLNASFDSSLILRPGERQPLYANAPPKPKRLNSPRDYSTSPERSPERDERDPRTYTDHGGGNGIIDPRNQDDRNIHYHPPSAERRTPDTYGVTAGGNRGDYEDVYGDINGSNSTAQISHRRPEQRDSFASSRSGGTRLSEELQLSEPLRPEFRGLDDTLPRLSHSSHFHHRQGPPRPHSADFLEYDRKYSNNDMWSYRRGSGGDLPKPNEMRPKSSIGQSELDHWSEENYAQKMRQSSLYHSHMHSRNSRYSPAGRGESPVSDTHSLHNSHNVSQRVPPAGAATPDLYTPHRPSGTVTPSSATNSLRRGAGLDARHQLKLDVSPEFRPDLSKQDIRSQDNRQMVHQDTRPELRHDSSKEPYRPYNPEATVQKYEPSPNSTLNSVPTPPGSCHNSISPNDSLNNSFMRSASARLPNQRLQDDVMNISLPDDGSDADSKKLQQREESMKRLLEWKQRMLQSPLTRKSSPRPDASAATPQPRTNSEAYRQQVLNELVSQEARSKNMHGHGHSQSLVSGMDSGHKGPLVDSHPGYFPSPVQNSPTPNQTNWNPAENSNYHGSSNSNVAVQGSSNPTMYVSSNSNSNLQGHKSQGHGYPSGRIPNERPAPQGSSSQQGSDSAGSTKKRDGRRENSRTRHFSGGDSRRSTSASRYNSYSSDDEDLLEERETRKRNRRSSRRSSADLIRDSRRTGYAPENRNSSLMEEADVQQKTEVPKGDIIPEYVNDPYDPYVPQIMLPASSPDYVNINFVSEAKENNVSEKSESVSVNNLCNERTLSQRAEPVFIENHDGYDEVKRFHQETKDELPSVDSNRNSNFVYNDRYYATRDPYYVSDVQLPAKTDKYEEENIDNSSMKNVLQNDLNVYDSLNSQKLNQILQEPQYANDIRSPESLNSKNIVSRMTHENGKDYQSFESSTGFPSYDSHISHKTDSISSHNSQRTGIQDDAISTGKYSDSGYDTLRAEISLQRDDRRNIHNSSLWNADSLESSPECSSVVRRRGTDKNTRRPETWSPDKFDRSWGRIDSDSKSKVDESKVVKEYSYEYITPEKNHDIYISENNLKNMPSSLKKSSPVLPCLESPKMVQETNQQTQKNLVQERIKKFTSKADTKEKYINSPENITLQSNHMNSKSSKDIEDCNELSNKSHKEPLKEPLKLVSPQDKSSEALVSPLKAEFATSESTVVTAQEAQVKNVSDYRKRDDTYGSPLSDSSSLSNNQYGLTTETPNSEYRELRSPQDIMDSRLSRTNIRKFLFDEDNKVENAKVLEKPQPNVKPPLMKKPTQSRSVKALLKNFEEKSIEHMERVNMNQDTSRRRFHSDSEMLSHESSSEEDPCDDPYDTTVIEKSPVSPASSVLADLRKSADIKKDEMIPSVPPPRPPKKPTLGGEMDSAISPSYLRMSLTDSIQESLNAQDDSDSGGESGWRSTSHLNKNKQNYHNIDKNHSIVDLDKPPEEEAPPPPPFYPPGGLQGPMSMSYAEENYLPMSPPKKLSHGSVTGPGSSCSSLSSKHLPTPEPLYPDAFAKTEYEEHTYIEMSGDTSSSAMSGPSAPRLDFSKINNDLFTPESPRYYEIGDKDDPQHYEYIYKGQSHYEAIYMEVPNSAKEEKPKIPEKPSDLKSPSISDRKYSSESHLNSSINKVDKAQSNASSDADDEASKDLDSLDPPRNPRFSLSDTFRPASYYLGGAEPSSDPDAQDSSDSDLVPPPPIPLSPPPLDELDDPNIKSKNFDFENIETPDPPAHLRNALTSSRSMRTSHSSLREDLNSSISSMNNDKKIFEQADSLALHVDKLKRRPVFDETLSNLHDDDSFILRSEDRYPASAAYPEDSKMIEPEKISQRERRKPFSQSDSVLLPGDKHEPSARPKSSLDHNTSFQSQLDTSISSNKHENPYANDNFQHNIQVLMNQATTPPSVRDYCNVPQNSKIFGQIERERSNSTGSRPKSPDPYSERNVSALQNSAVPRTSALRKSSQFSSNNTEPTGSPMIDALRGIHSPVSQLNISHQRTSSEASSRGGVVSPTSSILSGAVHYRGASNASVGSETSPRTAPYYYSDVIRDEAAFTESMGGTPRIRSYQLNNQRDLEANKRQDIGRKVNQITSTSEFEQRRERLVHELKTSVEFLEGKTVTSPDERNVYDSDTLRKMKRRAYTPDPELDAKNVFPYGLSIKSDGPPSASAVGHRRTRSLEGILDDPPRPLAGNNGSSSSTTDNKRIEFNHSQVSNTVKPGVPQIATSAPLGMRNNSTSLLNPNLSVSPAVTTQRGSLSQMGNQRTSLSSLHSSGSIAPGTTSPYATSPLPVSPLPPYPVGSRDSLVSRESTTSRISFHDSRSPHEFHQNSNDMRGHSDYPSPFIHDHPQTLHEEQEWEDDGHWREQLRRASLRHTRSLETLDENRPKRSGDGVNGENRPPAKLSVPNYPSQQSEETYHQRLKQLQLDEYTVDYREGRLGPNHSRSSSVQNTETLERTRRGLTCLEGYEWDENEEKFKRPNHAVHFRQPVVASHNAQHQSFLADGLPPSPEKECEEQCREQESPTLQPAFDLASPHPLQHPFSAGGDDDQGKSLGVGGRPQVEDETLEDNPAVSSPSSPALDDTTSITATTSQPVPDVVPTSDVKLGDSLPRRQDPNAPNSVPKPGANYPHQNFQQHIHPHQNYQHHPHPHSQNPYHHYKSDELQNYRHGRHPVHSNYQQNGPSYANFHPGGTHGYINYTEDHINYPNNYRQTHHRPSNYQDDHHQPPGTTRIDPREEFIDYNNTLNSQHSGSGGMNNSSYRRQGNHYDFQDYHNYKNHQHDFNHIQDYKQNLDYKSNPDYGTYNNKQGGPRYSAHPPYDERLNGRLVNDAHQQFSDSEITVSKARLAHLDGEHRQDHLRRLASLNHHLHDLDKQYEMGKPLINLVDNMVKLGSLYRGGDAKVSSTYDPRRIPASQHITNGYDSLQFSRRIQERRIVDEDLRLQEYELAAADQADLEGKVMQLYQLDRNLHQESMTIQSLQREKEMLERSLVNLHSKSHGANEGPVELERRKKQRRHLELELSKLRAHLAVSARKLEETAAENSRLEHEMMMLRQKIQMAMTKNSHRESGTSSETRHIESEMIRVQTLLEDLQRRRIELSHQIQRLTSSNPGIELRPAPTGVIGAAPIPARRRKSTWLETELDTMITKDWGLDLPETGVVAANNPPVYVNASRYDDEERVPTDYSERQDFSDPDYPPPPPPPEQMRTYSHQVHESPTSLVTDPVQNEFRYSQDQPSLEDSNLAPQLANGDICNPSMLGLDRDSEDNKPDGEEQQHSGSHLDINEADDRMKRYYGILPKEKPLEIKTVRIVKRENTERKKDRTTIGTKRVTIGESLNSINDDDIESDDPSDVENEPPEIPSFAARSASLPRNYGRNGPGERVSMMAAMMRTSVGNSGTMTRPNNLALKKSTEWKSKNDNSKDRPKSAHEQLFGFSREAEQTPPSSPSKSDPPSPVFKSAAAQQIIKEMASEAAKHRRAVPKEKRRHFTISSSQPLTLETRDTDIEEGARSRDDCDMERALRPRNHPDVVKSTLSSKDLRFNETTIDSILGAPNKIFIPERYMPDEDDEKEPTEEERAAREQKAQAIRKMLSESQTTITKGETSGEGSQPESETLLKSSSTFKAKMEAEKKEREHILALNQILARQVMEKSRVVAAHNTVEPHL